MCCLITLEMLTIYCSFKLMHSKPRVETQEGEGVGDITNSLMIIH